jgi:hypothetical protein
MTLPLAVARRRASEARGTGPTAALRPASLARPRSATTSAPIAIGVAALVRGELGLLALGHVAFRARQCRPNQRPVHRALVLFELAFLSGFVRSIRWRERLRGRCNGRRFVGGRRGGNNVRNVVGR